MADGLTIEDLDSLLASKPSSGGSNFDRADAIRSEIYQRHGIPSHRTLEEAIDRINMQARLRSSLGNEGGEPSGWANHEERAAHQAKYVLEAASPREARTRDNQSMHLLDPRTYRYMQDFGRDLDFLQSEHRNEKSSATLRRPRRVLDVNAIRYYDSSKDQPLARTGIYGNPLHVTSGAYQRWSGVQNALMNAVNNPETPIGSYFTWGEIPASAMLTSWSDREASDAERANDEVMARAGIGRGLADGLVSALQDKDSWDRAKGKWAANVRHLPFTPTPVADFPHGSKPSEREISRRIAEIQEQVRKAETPMSGDRWHRSVGVVPPGWVTDPGEAAVRWVDPSAAIPALAATKAAVGGAAATARAARIAGAGWRMPYIGKAVSPVAAGLGWDMAHEQGLNLGMQGALGGEPGRSSRQFWVGFGTPGKDFMVRTPEEVEESRKAGRELTAARSGDERVSRVKREAYEDLRSSGAFGPFEQMRSRANSRNPQ